MKLTQKILTAEIVYIFILPGIETFQMAANFMVLNQSKCQIYLFINHLVLGAHLLKVKNEYTNPS